MTMRNLTQRPDLRCLFGPLSPEQNDHLLDRLLAINTDLRDLAIRASAHVGVPYHPIGLHLSVRPDGTSMGIDGGPSGDAGDIWFDISPADGCSGPPWVVESRLVVFCSDSPEPRGEPNTHDLVRIEATGTTPSAVLDILVSHVASMTLEIDNRPREVFTMSAHSLLP